MLSPLYSQAENELYKLIYLIIYIYTLIVPPLEHVSPFTSKIDLEEC